MPNTNLYLTVFTSLFCFLCELLRTYKIRLFESLELFAVKDPGPWNQNHEWISHWFYGISEEPGARNGDFFLSLSLLTIQ